MGKGAAETCCKGPGYATPLVRKPLLPAEADLWRFWHTRTHRQGWHVTDGGTCRRMLCTTGLVRS